MALAQQRAARSGGSGGSREKSSSQKYAGYKKADLVAEAKDMLSKTNDNNEYLYDSGAVITALRQLGVTDRDELEDIIKAAGGKFNVGWSSQSNIR